VLLLHFFVFSFAFLCALEYKLSLATVVDTVQPTPFHKQVQIMAAIICASGTFLFCFLFLSNKLTIDSNGDLCYATPNHL
jgi:hypothetical protein